jgi:uncharacterized protein (TIGR03435 family)
MRSVFSAAAAAIAGSLMLAAQTPAPGLNQAPRQFDVASIRKTDAERPKVYTNPFSFSPGGRFTATNVTLTDIIVMAYKTRRIQMRGGPAWIDSERFNILAQTDAASGEVKPEQWAPLVQALLEDRFKLLLHREIEESTVYALVPGKTPPRIQPAKDGEKTTVTPGEHGQLNFTNIPVVGLVNTLANILHAPVVDQTGIKGFFDFTLDPLALSDPKQPVTPDAWPDLVLAAVREQLGFKLEKRKEPLEITIIDHAEQPSEN